MGFNAALVGNHVGYVADGQSAAQSRAGETIMGKAALAVVSALAFRASNGWTYCTSCVAKATESVEAITEREETAPYCIECGGKIEEAGPDPKRLVQVSVYGVSRCYGGPEEGGWWWDCWAFEGTSIRCRANKAERAVKRLEREFADRQPKYDRHSSRGGTDILVVVEEKCGERNTLERPRYE